MGRWFDRTISYVIMIIIFAISLYPFVWLLESTFKTQYELFNSGIKLPTHFNLHNYVYAFQNAPLLLFLRNSTLVTLFSTGLCLLVVGMAAYAVAHFVFRGKAVIIAIFAATLFIPGISLTVPIFKLVQLFGLLDTKTALVYIYTAFGLPIAFFILRSFFLSVPREIAEAAYIDGANFSKTFLKIMMPIAKSGFVTAGILNFLNCWNEFYYALIITTHNDARTLPLALSFFKDRFTTSYPALFATMIFIALPVIIVFYVFQKQVVSSLTAGAMKG